MRYGAVRRNSGGGGGGVVRQPNLLMLFGSLIQDLQHFVEFGGREVESCNNPSVRTKFVLFHHLFVVDSVLPPPFFLKSDVGVTGVENVVSE